MSPRGRLLAGAGAISLAVAGAIGLAVGAGPADEAPTTRARPTDGPTPTPAEDDGFDGIYRAVLRSPGGELPFTLVIGGTGDAPARAMNAGVSEPFDAVERDGERIVLHMRHYDSRIEARREGERLVGEWSRASSGERSRLPFEAIRGERARFDVEPDLARPTAAAVQAVPAVAGHFRVTFTDDGGDSPARAELAQEGSRVTGTIQTPPGDHRFLEGSYEGGLLRLSAFDGSHAFLLHARAEEDGRLVGDFWSRDTYHATWTATRLADPGEQVLPDGFAEVRVVSDDGRFRFSFPDVEGRIVSNGDPRFAGKVLVVELFGTWCPNCADLAPLLDRLYRERHGRGLEVVGLAFEYSGETDRDTQQLRLYAAHHGVTYPLLLVGTASKARASELLPDLSAVRAFPTTIFVGRDGRVREIYSGFAGPATGAHHAELVARFEATLDRLLAE